MRSRFLAVVGFILLPAAALWAQTPQELKSHMKVASTITVANTSPDLSQYFVPRDPQHNGVAYLQIERPDLPANSVDVCTGALINGGWSVLTAAHCVSDASGHLVATGAEVRFIPPTGNTYELIHANNFAVNSAYTGAVIDQHDVAVINLSAQVTNVTSYSLYGGAPLNKMFDVVGWGLRGTGNAGITEGVYAPRHGFNNFDFSGTDPIFGDFFGDQNVLFSDFDNGTPAQDASCWLTGLFVLDNSRYCNYGLGSNEVNTAGGDSGGPEFINIQGTYQIAGVTSFGLTFGNSRPGYPDIDDLLNSSYGEYAGYTRTDINSEWINSAVTTPEPSSFALVGTGLIGIVPMFRRRRKKG